MTFEASVTAYDEFPISISEPGRPSLPRVVPYDANAVNVTYKLPGYGGLPTSFTVYYKHKGDEAALTDLFQRFFCTMDMCPVKL